MAKKKKGTKLEKLIIERDRLVEESRGRRNSKYDYEASIATVEEQIKALS